ncbi:hypothetical protein [Bradyrhizobium sp. Ai1a-2]|uniref:hypothetical protein n=1 Tax=Bradyrhizobium sp. Ai1a-2 TaxID=196490 RepID=UPI0004223628|nr:hypothetical protein [Bradyrhizobium sp. Ai1a-2]
MTPEETARYHSDRPGFELIDFAEVGLPVFKIYIIASLLLHTPLPPIFEFVLRCVKLGVDTCGEISACLGIPSRMVDQALKALYRAEELAFVPNDLSEADRFILTRKGERTVTSLEQILPELQTLPIYFDGLTRKPIAPPAIQLLKGKEAVDFGLKEIPALPATRVEAEDIDISLAARLFNQERVGEARRDLLAIKAIDRRMRLHLPATVLVFRSTDGNEVELSFAIESKLLDDHSRAFALAEGPKKARLLTDLAKPHLIGTDSFSRRISAIDRQIDEVSAAAKKPRLTLLPRTPQLPRNSLRRLSVLEHPPILWDAITTAKDRLLIICPWITAQVVDAKMLKEIEALLERKVRFYLGFGLDEQGGKKAKPIPEQLEKLSLRYNNFVLLRLGNTHEKILIKDREYAVLTSFNWLSFKGDPTRALRLERGVCISEPEYVESEFVSLAPRFDAPAGRRKGGRDENEPKGGKHLPASASKQHGSSEEPRRQGK